MMKIYPLEDIEAVKNCMLELHATIAVAESVTAGHLQGALSQAKDARRFFQGGLTVYNIGQKCRQLRVEPVHALECNGVSPQVAEEMASHVAELFCSAFGIGITGYVAPVPEKNVRTPFAFYCIFGKGQLLKADRLDGQGEDAIEVQLYYVRRVIAVLREVMEDMQRQHGDDRHTHE